MMDHSSFVIGCLLLIIPVVNSNYSPVQALIGSNATLEWTEARGVYNQPEYRNKTVVWRIIKGFDTNFYMIINRTGSLVPNRAIVPNNGSHQVLLLDETKQRIGLIFYGVTKDEASTYKLDERETIELLVYAVSDLRVTVETLNVTESIELENANPLNLHTEQTNLTITLNLGKTAPESAKVTSTRIFKNGSRETTNLQCTQDGGRWLNRTCPVQMNLSHGDYDTTELTLDYLVEGTEPIILMVVTTPAVESVITTAKQVAIGVSVTVSLAVIAVIIGVILYIKKRNKGRHETLEEQVPLKRMTKADQQRQPDANTSGRDSSTADSSDTATKGSRNGAEKRVTKLAGFMVPLDERDCPEHTFLVPFTKDELIAKDYPVIGRITNALLNAMGGILILESTDTLTKSERNSWHQTCTDYMKGSMPEKIAASIHFRHSPSGMIMFIPKSKDLMLYNGCIITRSKTGNRQILDYDSLVDIVNRKSGADHYLQMNHSYYFDDKLFCEEGQNREYINWEETSFGDIINHIAPGSNTKHQESAKTFRQTLLAMANEPSGGEVIMGIAKIHGEFWIKGLHLEDADREEFEDVIDEVLRNDPVTGELRVWREPGRFPEKNTHWCVKYHNVIGTPGKEKRVIARIQIKHYPGGVFEVEPVAYDVDQDGYITQKPFAEWRERMEENITTAPVTDVKTSSRLKAGSIPEAGIESMNQETPDSDTRVDDGTSYIKAVDQEAMDAVLRDRKELSWTKDKLNWSERLEESEVKMEKDITSDFALKKPLNFIHPKETVLRRHPFSDEKIKKIEEYHQSDRGFVICVESWMSYLMEKTIPEGHEMDLLVFVQKEGIKKGSNFHELHLWVICGTAENQKDDWKYAVQTSLSLKRQLIEGGCPAISVICHTMQDNHTLRSSKYEDEITQYLYTNSEETVESVKLTLAKILFQKDLHFTTRIGNRALIKLSEEQAKNLLKCDQRQITFICGPPGSGKTILATCIAKQYNDPKKVQFVCTTKSFRNYILFSVNCESYLVKSGEVKELKKWIESVVQNKSIKCLIFDDVHNLECTKEDWCAILKQLVESGKKIHLFADPDIQAYKETNSMKDLRRALTDCSVIPYQDQLTEVHRNTRIVTAFIKDASPVGIQIKAAHELDGDDIEMLYKGGLRLIGADNGLVVLIQELTLDYPPHDIAVLLGGENAVEDKNFYTEVLSQHLDCKVHGADHHPPEGVQVDVVDEYLGLDAPVVIHLNAKSTPAEKMDNPKYKSFIASRGIFRVIFLVEEPLNHKDYKQIMKLDKPLERDADSTQHAEISNKIGDDLQEAASSGAVSKTLGILEQELEGAAPEPDLPKYVHYGVRCDGCMKIPVVGDRFNCQVCSNYNLCSECKTKGLHPKHKMKCLNAATLATRDLQAAAKAGDVDSVSALLKQGADINFEVWLHGTALVQAAGSDKLDMVKLLLSLGADIEGGEYKPLSQAAWRGHIDIIQCLLQHGADINAEDWAGRTALGEAARCGKLEAVKLLLSQAADIEGGRSKPLSLAAYEGRIDTVQCLLQHGADINGQDGYGRTALGMAAQSGKLEVVKLLLSQGADINTKDGRGVTALGWAAERGELEVVKLLLSKEADIELGWRKPLSRAALYCRIDIVQCLLQHGADINGVDGDGYTALGEAAGSGKLEVVKLLLSQGADTERGKYKPLSRAAYKGRLNTVQCLLEHGADINAEDGDSYTALGWAAERGELEIVKLLLSQGADPERGEKPLSRAAGRRHIDIVQCLLQHGADIHGVDGYGRTALGEAARSGQLKMVELLLSLGADVEQGSEKPLSLAAGESHIDTVQCLLQHGADVNAVDVHGYTALGRAAASGHLEIVKLLLSRGADVERGKSKPLSLAAGEGHIDTVQCLLQHGASQEAKNHALTEALKTVQDVPEDWSDGRKAGLKQTVKTLKSHGAIG